jgi:HSP20 family protein
MPKANCTAPAINVKESDKAYTVELAAPGMNKQDFNVHINDEGNLVVKMEHKEEHKEEENKNVRYLRREFSYSKYEQTLILPDDVKKDAISAKVEDGVLTVELPKVVEEKVKLSRQIEIA